VDLKDEVIFKAWQLWAISEITYWQQRAEELEIDLMLSKSDFGVNERTQASVNPKRRSNFI
jgi:hypothetical protein